MRATRRLFAALAIVLSAGLAMAFDKGPPVGAQIPSQLDALDSGGVEQSFAKLKGEKGLVLVFIRATAWCPYCQKQVIELESIRKDIEARGYRVAIVSTDTPEKLNEFRIRQKINFALLSDDKFRIIDQFNLRDPAYPPGKRFHGVPVPSIFFVSTTGEVKAKLGDDDYRIRPAPEVVLSTLDSLR